MNKKTWLIFSALNALIITMIISPFLPGPSNQLVLWLSIAGQLLGTAGLLLVPIGAAWTWMELKGETVAQTGQTRKRQTVVSDVAVGIVAAVFLIGAIVFDKPMPRATCIIGALILIGGSALARFQLHNHNQKSETLYDNGARFKLAIAAICCLSFTYLFMCLFVMVGIGILAGIILLAAFPPLLTIAIRSAKKLKENRRKKTFVVPLGLTVIPLIAFATFLFLVRPASRASREFAIERGQQIVNAIEAYRATTGEYPASLSDLEPAISKKELKTSIMGAGNFRYQKINDQYSLAFSQWLDLGSLEVLVLYEKENIATQLPVSLQRDHSLDLNRIKGAFAQYDTKYSNWRYYYLD